MLGYTGLTVEDRIHIKLLQGKDEIYFLGHQKDLPINVFAQEREDMKTPYHRFQMVSCSRTSLRRKVLFWEGGSLGRWVYYCWNDNETTIIFGKLWTALFYGSLVLLLTWTYYIQGESDIEQLAIVLQNLGTPTKESWPGHADLPDFHKITFPDSTPTPWPDLLPGVEPDALSLIKSFIMYDADRRISAKEVPTTLLPVHLSN